MDKDLSIEGNKLIAEFMGCNPTSFKNEGGSGYDVRLNGVPKVGYMTYALTEYGTKKQLIAKLLKWPFHYHTSWDWLMPVVQKINETNSNGIAMHWLINKQWEVVVSFIKHYNTTKSNSNE